MDYKRILTVQDISCFGQCSLTVALPILSACGAETVIIPSAVLSTHTGGFTDMHFEDLEPSMHKIADHFDRLGLRFDAIYTGFLGSEAQIEIVEDFIRTFGKDCTVMVDPVMGDNGKLYSIFNDEYVEAMRGLCGSADILIPNITEACFLAKVE